jgi:hypothetical protein
MLSFSISNPDLIKFSYFADTTDYTSGKSLARYASEESKEKNGLKHDEIYYNKTSSLFNFYKEKSL